MGLNDKEINRMKTTIRSKTFGQKTIKVVYLGNVHGFHFGKIIEAEARHVRSTGKEFPFPKWEHCDYRIDDQDGDTFTISEDGRKFYKGFYPVPDYYKTGFNLIKK